MIKTNNSQIRRFWVSWIQPTEDYRPLSYPPGDSIIGWWCSGYDGQDNPILMALIQGTSEDDVIKAVKADWPEWENWRIFEEKEVDWKPGSRFPLSDWMKERI